MAQSNEIAQALEDRVDALLKQNGHPVTTDPGLLALIQALGELLADDEDQQDPAE